MCSKKGFTLVEVLIVVAISLSVLIFAVPTYKKTQAKIRHEAAIGVLINVGEAVNIVREKIEEAHGSNSGKMFPGTSNAYRIWPYTQKNGLASDALTAYGRMEISDGHSKGDGGAYLSFLFMRKFIAPIPFDKNANTYKGYKIFICPQENTEESECCPSDLQAVACIQLDKNVANLSEIEKTYFGAYYTKKGEVIKIYK